MKIRVVEIDISCADLTRNSVSEISDKIRHEMIDGSGLVILRGAGSSDWTDRSLRARQLRIARSLGRLRTQNRAGERVVDVKDTRPEDSVNARGYRTNVRMDLHTDGWDVASLLCLSSADKGGNSVFASSLAIAEAMAVDHPSELRELERPQSWFMDVLDDRDGTPALISPVFSRHMGRLSCRYSGYMLRSGWNHGAAVPKTLRHALNRFDGLATSPSIRFETRLERGDSAWFNNRTVLHGRTAFNDTGTGTGSRHLVRLWIDMPDYPDLDPNFASFDHECFGRSDNGRKSM